MVEVAIVDYGLGNLRSVLRGLEKAGARTVITADAATIASADGIVLPGVGAFREGMEMLGDLDETVVAGADTVPVLGICLGMQMLMEESEEHGLHAGLGLVPGRVRRFPQTPGFKVPHMGWNTIQVGDDSGLFAGLAGEHFVYFVHSFYAEAAARYTLATTEYSVPFASSIRNGNTYGVQFHPEKSGSVGLAILENFIEML